MVVVIRRALAQASLKWCLELSVHIVIVQFKKNNALQHCLTNKCNVTTVVMCFITKPLTDQHCSRHITVCVSHLIKHKLMQKTLLHSLFNLKIHCKYQTWTLLMRTLLLCVTVVLAIAVNCFDYPQATSLLTVCVVTHFSTFNFKTLRQCGAAVTQLQTTQPAEQWHTVTLCIWEAFYQSRMICSSRYWACRD